MSWLGGSLSSLTGQLSNLTKDILTEGTEEVSDHATELRLAQEKLKELDALVITQKVENERLKHVVQEAEEKAESSELQINSISREYRAMLEAKEKEIQALKLKQHEHVEFSSSFATEESNHPAILRLSSDGFESVGYQGDEHDFSDNIAMQQEVNRLRGDVQKLQTECQHWKSLVQQNKSNDGLPVHEEDKGDNSELFRQIQELQRHLSVERDERQSQLSSLQDAHAQKITALRKRHKEEVTELKQKISELDWGSDGWESQAPDDSAALRQTISSLQEEIAGLRLERDDHLQQISELNSTIEIQKSEMAISEAKALHLESQLKVSEEEVSKLQADHDQADTLDVLSDLREVRRVMDKTAIDRRHKLQEEKDQIVSQMIVDGIKKKELSDAVSKLEKEQNVLEQEAKEMVAELGDPQHQKLTADIINTLETENLLLKKRNVGLQEQVTLLEKAVQNLTKEKQATDSQSEKAENTTTESGIQGQDSDNFSDTMSFTSDLSELSRRNLELDEQVTNLKAQINRYESEIEQFEFLKSDWQTEKESLEDVLMQLREQMREKENSLNLIEAQKGLAEAVVKGSFRDQSYLSPTWKDKKYGLLAVEEREQRETTNITHRQLSNTDTVSETGSESFENIADDIVKLDGKVGLLTDANAKLEQQRDKLLNDKEKLQKELNELKKKILLSEEAEQREKDTTELKQHLQEKETELQSLMEEKEDLERNLALLPDLKQQLKQKEEEVENLLKVTSVVGEEAHQNEIGKLKEELKSMEDEISKHTKEKEEMETARKEVEECKRKLRNKDVEVVNLTLEKEEMMSSLEELDNQHQEAMEQIIKVRDTLSKTNEELQSKLRTAENEVQSLRTELDHLKQQHIVNQSVESSDSNELNQEIAELKEENNQLRQRLSNCDTTILELTEDIMLKDTQIEEMDKKMLSSASALNNLHMDKQELESKITKLKEQLNSKVQEIKSFKESKDSQRTSDLKSNELQAKETLLSSADSDSSSEIHALTQETESLRSQLKESKVELSKKANECVQMQSNAQALSSELENVRKNNEKLMAECDSLNKLIRSKESDNELLIVSIKEKTADLVKLQEEKEYLEHDRSKLQKESDRKTGECESFSRQIHSLESHVTSLKDRIVEQENINKSQLSKVDLLTQEMNILKNESAVHEDERQAEISALKSQIETAESEKKAKEIAIEELEQTNNTLNSEIMVLKEVIEEKDHDCDRLNSQILSSSNELVLLREELNDKGSEIESLKDDFQFEKQAIFTEHSKETDWLKSQVTTLKKEKEDLQDIFEKDICDLKEEHDADLTKLKKANKELSQANKDLSRDLAGLETRYETYIEQLKSSIDTDHSGLQSQYNQVLEDSHKKDLTINSLESQISSIQDQLCDSKESLVTLEESKKKVLDILNEKEKEICNIKEFVSGLQDEKTKIEAEKNKLEEEYANYKIAEAAKSETLALQLEKMNDYENLKQRLKESDDTSVGEKLLLETRIKDLEAELENYLQVIKDHEAGIAELNKEKLHLKEQLEKEQERWQADEGMVHVLKHTNSQKDIEIQNLQRKLHRAKSFVDEDQQKVIESEIISPNYDLPALEYKEKGEIELHEVCETIQPVMSAPLSMEKRENIQGDEIERHKIDISKQIDTLKDQLSEKDDVIGELQRNNSSLLKMLETKSKTAGGDANLVEMHRLENENKSLQREREQMMDVMNEKSKEVSSLKVEVHRLMNIVSAEKAAIEKLQKDSQEMSRTSANTSGNHIDDMQKEVVQNLSRIIRDKDLEIESLKQKSDTLLSVLQDSSQDGNQINSLMVDKENLTKQLAALQTEREQMIAYLNQKHQESLAYHNEVQRLTTVINTESARNAQIAMDYEKLVPQFEDKTQALLKTQNELINYKQRYTDLEVKYGQLLQQSNIDESVDKATFNSKSEELTRLQERYKELMDNVKEKEMKVQNLHQNINELEQNFRTADHERNSYKKQVDNFVFQLHGLQTEQKDLKSEIAHIKQQNAELSTENKTLKELNNKLTLQLQDREFEVKTLQEKTTTLTNILQESQGDQTQLDNLMQENEIAQQRMKHMQHERDQAVLAIQQKQAENEKLFKDVHILQEKEDKLKRELDRLRQHLIAIEDGYTAEAVLAEEREKELRNRLATAEENIFSNSSAVETASQQASQQLENLQQQLQYIANQRDQAYLQISTLQEQNQMYSMSMANLQMVLEQFQQEKENMVAQETEKYESEVKTLRSQSEKLTADLKYTKEQLDEASDGLAAASRLSEQLDRKEEAIDALREEVQMREAALKLAEDELHKLKSRSDDKVDKLIIKNLFLGYFTTPQNKRHDVLRAIGGVLMFTQDDFEKVEGEHKGWVPGFLKFGGSKPVSPPTTPVRRSTIAAPTNRGKDNSFSEMFVRFLEKESSPPPPAVRLPAEEMARDVQKQKEAHKPAYNPFTAPRHVAMPTGPTELPGTSPSPHILMSTSTPVSHALPTFAAPSESSRTPPGSGRNTPSSSSAILKDVLNAR